MTSTDILRTASKIFGLYFILQVIAGMRDILFYLTELSTLEKDSAFMVLTSQIYMGTFNVVVGLILILKANWVAAKLAPNSTGELGISVSKKDWLELTLIIISGLTILYSFPEIFYKLTYYIYFNDYDVNERNYFWTNRNKADFFYSIFKFAFGLFVILNARNFAGRLQKIGEKDEKLSK